MNQKKTTLFFFATSDREEPSVTIQLTSRNKLHNMAYNRLDTHEEAARGREEPTSPLPPAAIKET